MSADTSTFPLSMTPKQIEDVIKLKRDVFPDRTYAEILRIILTAGIEVKKENNNLLEHVLRGYKL